MAKDDMLKVQDEINRRHFELEGGGIPAAFHSEPKSEPRPYLNVIDELTECVAREYSIPVNLLMPPKGIDPYTIDDYYSLKVIYGPKDE